MRSLAAFLTLTAVSLLTPRLWATASYVYHERSARDVTEGAPNSSCGEGVIYTAPAAPGAGEPETLRLKVEFAGYTDQARVYYTMDGSQPGGALGASSGSSQVSVASFVCTYTPFADTIDVLEASLPGQAAGTTVRYIVSAWHSGGGDEMFANSGTCQGCTACTSASCARVFSYTVPELDAGTSDAASPDTATPDTATPDTATPDTATPDTATPDTATPDTATPDTATPDTATPDTATPDTATLDTAMLDAGSCTPGCQDESTRVACGSQGQRIEIPCSAGTRCAEGRCQKPPADTPQNEGGGCSCRSQASGAATVLLAGGMPLLLRRRRKERRC